MQAARVILRPRQQAAATRPRPHPLPHAALAHHSLRDVRDQAARQAADILAPNGSGTARGTPQSLRGLPSLTGMRKGQPIVAKIPSARDRTPGTAQTPRIAPDATGQHRRAAPAQAHTTPAHDGRGPRRSALYEPVRRFSTMASCAWSTTWASTTSSPSCKRRASPTAAAASGSDATAASFAISCAALAHHALRDVRDQAARQAADIPFVFEILRAMVDNRSTAPPASTNKVPPATPCSTKCYEFYARDVPARDRLQAQSLPPSTVEIRAAATCSTTTRRRARAGAADDRRRPGAPYALIALRRNAEPGRRRSGARPQPPGPRTASWRG